MQPYDPNQIEPKWADRWEEERAYAAGGPASGRPTFYALDMFPYPSGDLHMGHAEAFAIGDAIARYRWMRGFDVFHPIGWDSFGLPAENAAIRREIHPKEWTYANIERQASSFRQYGMSFDWSTRLHTSDRIVAPSERPIQLRSSVMTRSVHSSSVSTSSSSRCA